jgi:hypothetical protein
MTIQKNAPARAQVLLFPIISALPRRPLVRFLNCSGFRVCVQGVHCLIIFLAEKAGENNNLAETSRQEVFNTLAFSRVIRKRRFRALSIAILISAGLYAAARFFSSALTSSLMSGDSSSRRQGVFGSSYIFLALPAFL